MEIWRIHREMGWTVREIATRYGVSPSRVAWATLREDPYPAERRLDPRIPSWIERRKAGETCAEIARTDGVSESTVGRRTAPFGPFPRRRTQEDEVAAWIAARDSGVPIRRIAREAGVSVSRVERALKPHPRPPGLPKTLSRNQIAVLAGAPPPTILNWSQRADFPVSDATPATRWPPR